MEQHIGEQIIQVGGRPIFGYTGYSCGHSFPALMIAKLTLLFFNVNSGVETFLWTDSLSQNMLYGLYIGIPNIHNLYRRDLNNYVTILRAMNSLKNVLVSTVFCCLLYHSMGYLFTDIMNLVWNLLVALLLALSVSTKNVWRTHLALELDRLPVWPIFIMVEVMPIVSRKWALINRRMLRIKAKLSLQVILDVPKHMEYLFEMSSARQS